MVVEIENDNVSRIFPLSEESERVQWMPGVSVLLSDTDVTKDFNREAMLADKIRPLLAETKIVDYIASNMNEVIMQKKWTQKRLSPTILFWQALFLPLPLFYSNRFLILPLFQGSSGSRY